MLTEHGAVLSGQGPRSMDSTSDALHSSTHDATASVYLQRIALSAVQLGALGPRLARLADDMAAQAREQALRAKTVADNMQELTQHLDAATRELRGSSAEVERALTTVARIADHTRILAINASIEANRAGEHGRPFAIVVQEVQRLADRTGETTSDIESRVRDMHASLDRVTAMTGNDDDPAHGGAGESTASVGALNRQIQGIATSAHVQLESTQALKSMGGGVRTGTDSLLLAVGTFRFAAHARAEAEVQKLGAALAAMDSERATLERCIERWLAAHPHFELAYLTNHAGRQIVDNIANAGGRSRRDPAGFGRDWSARPWYRRAIDARAPVSTDIYRSAATGDFCFTVSLAVRDARGQVRGVVAADVNFQQMTLELQEGR